jgi:hypothetical protein
VDGKYINRKRLVGKPEGSGHLGNLGQREEESTKWSLAKLCDDADWIHVDQDRFHLGALVNTVMNHGFL